MNKDKSNNEAKQEAKQEDTQANAEKETVKTKPVAESNVKKNTPTTSPVKPSSKKQQPSTQTPKNLAGKISLFVSLLLIIILVSAMYWLWPIIQQEQEEIETAQKALSQYQRRLNQTLDEKSQQINQQQQQINELLSALENSLSAQQIIAQRLDAHAAQLTTLSGTSRDAWIVEEVRYLLRLANQRRLMGGDANGVMGLLGSADNLLKELDAPDLFSVREAIAKNIIALKIAPKIDREGIYLQLLALQQQVESLPSAPLKLLSKKVEEQKPEEESLSFWNKIWMSMTSIFTNIDQYVRVTHHDEPVIPVLSEEQAIAQRQQLQLIFEQAKIALLKENEVMYQESLLSAKNVLLKNFQYFQENQSLVESIQLLKNQRIIIVLPDISSSLERLDNYLLQKNINIDPSHGGDEKDNKVEETPSDAINTSVKETAI